ncbi:MAG: GNAT family N-acetyltransferase [Bacteroidetes bacterium]|nr:GNAT family N-acetyltransferase [Bacteroidota bacterium]
MEIKPVNINSTVYKNLVAKSGSIFNSPQWLSIYDEKQLVVLGIYNANNDLIGSFFFYRFKKLNIISIIPPPFSPSIGLFFTNPAKNNSNIISTNRELQKCIIEYFNKIKSHQIDLSFSPDYKDFQLFLWNGFEVSPAYTYHINLALSKEVLFENLSSEKRKSIRKAELDNILIKYNDQKTIVFDLIKQTFSRKQKKLNENLLEKILFQFSNQSNSYSFVAYNKDKPIATCFFIYDKTTVYYIAGGYNMSNKHHGAGVLCMWSGILKAKEMNIQTFDFEGSMLPEVERYFRDFGGELTPYFRVKKINTFIKAALKLKNK